MFGKLLLIFIGIPFLEMVILIQLGALFGFWSAVLLVLVTGFIGASLARVQGFRAYQAIQAELREGRVPGEKMIDALLIFAAGILLITPGFLTDMAGFLLLIPWSRFYFKRWLRKKFDEWISRGSSGPGGPGSGFRFYIGG